MRFADIYSDVETLANVTSQRSLIKRAIQRGLYKATDKDLPYLMTDGRITTVAPYETGTVAMTNNSTTVTGTDTVWTSAMVGRKIRFSGEQAYYRISAVGGNTSLTLETVYQGTSDTDATYSIYKDEYRLPPDCDTYKIMRQIEEGTPLFGIEATAFDMLEPTPTSEGSPDFEILIGSKLDTYTTGTVSGTVNGTTITGSSSLWTGVEGLAKGSKITIGSYVYTVKSVDSDTQITTYEKLVVTVAAGTSYSILLDNLIVQFFEIPDAIENIYFRYQRLPYPLVNDEDIPDLPVKYHHILTTAGLCWAWMTKDKEEAVRQEQVFRLEVLEMWKRIGYISVSRRYPRKSMDTFVSLGSPRFPTDYNIPYSV